MTADEAYQRYLLELQANGVTDNIQTTKSKFVINFNKAQNRAIEFLIERKNEDDNRYLQKIKILNKSLYLDERTEKEDKFTLPEDFFDHIDVLAYATKGDCINQEFFVYEIKGENLNTLLNDEFSKPSWKFRESFYILGEDKVTLIKSKDFKFTKATLSYYRYPQQLSLKSPDFPDSPLLNTTLEFDDKLSNRIITLAAADQSLNANDSKYKALKQEVLSKL